MQQNALKVTAMGRLIGLAVVGLDCTNKTMLSTSALTSAQPKQGTVQNRYTLAILPAT